MSVKHNQTSPDDIPEALRDVPPTANQKRQRRGLRRGLTTIGLGLIAMLISIYLGNLNSEPTTVSTSQPQQNNKTVEETAPPSSDGEGRETLLGHFAYQEASPDSLTKVTADGRITLKTPAAEQFVEMQNAARADGVFLVPLSGFRSQQQQKELFFGIKAKRGQDTLERAQVSAPPGYSEHHTGYAIDIGDQNHRDTHFQPSFDETPAFEWLKENAASYNFEMSFPKDNSQGVKYEPWHWRYVGNQESLEIFYQPS